MLFDLCNAPATFERLMEKVLHPVLNRIYMVYLDDIIIFGKTFEEMVKILREVFLLLREANLKLNLKKCTFFKKKVKYLISEKGITTDSEEIEIVWNWPVSRSRKQVCSFLGFCSYYRKFKKFFLIAKPLFSLTENQKIFIWDKSC